MSDSSKSVSRRQFAVGAARVGAYAAAPVIVAGPALGQSASQTAAVPPSDRIVMGAIGIGGRGTDDLKCFLNDPRVQVVANCDIREDRRESVKSLVDSKQGNSDCTMYRDAQELLARPDIEAVLIATSDRWHSLMSILAAEAGKDIFWLPAAECPQL
ncbi:MAG: Gfo/Idh/MocA family oxidoreductase [Acidobacteria bacterium]|nr:Gfo/Idh/MocA family oxidoreductase [Acidobacteriota bacterium]